MSSSSSRSPSPVVHEAFSTTDSDDDRLGRYWQANVPTDVLQDYDTENGREALRILYPLPPRRPRIHRGPQETSIHTTVRKGDLPRYKIVFSYRDPPRDYEHVLRKLTYALRDQHPVLKCKVFTNPTRHDRLAFAYLAETTTVADLLQITRIIREVFHPPRMDLRTPEERGRILMRF